MDSKSVGGNISGWSDSNGDNLRYPSTTWLQFRVQLDTPVQAAAYRQSSFSLMGWLKFQNLVPKEVRLQQWLAMGFLFVCMLNIVALLRAKFLRRNGGAAGGGDQDGVDACRMALLRCG